MRKLITLITLVAFVCFSYSCTTSRIAREKVSGFWQQEYKVWMIKKNAKIIGVKKISGEYIHFSKDTPAIINGAFIDGELAGGPRFDYIRISLDKIEYVIVKREEENYGKTCLWTGGIIVGAAIVVGIVVGIALLISFSDGKGFGMGF